MVKLLLEREEVNPDKPGDNGRTPLSYAAEGKHEGVAKLLLECEEVDPGRPMMTAKHRPPLLLCMAIIEWQPY